MSAAFQLVAIAPEPEIAALPLPTTLPEPAGTVEIEFATGGRTGGRCLNGVGADQSAGEGESGADDCSAGRRRPATPTCARPLDGLALLVQETLKRQWAAAT
jgi:hypothetical protein